MEQCCLVTRQVTQQASPQGNCTKYVYDLHSSMYIHLSFISHSPHSSHFTATNKPWQICRGGTFRARPIRRHGPREYSTNTHNNNIVAKAATSMTTIIMTTLNTTTTSRHHQGTTPASAPLDPACLSRSNSPRQDENMNSVLMMPCLCLRPR